MTRDTNSCGADGSRATLSGAKDLIPLSTCLQIGGIRTEVEVTSKVSSGSHRPQWGEECRAAIDFKSR